MAKIISFLFDGIHHMIHRRKNFIECITIKIKVKGSFHPFSCSSRWKPMLHLPPSRAPTIVLQPPVSSFVMRLKSEIVTIFGTFCFSHQSNDRISFAMTHTNFYGNRILDHFAHLPLASINKTLSSLSSSSLQVSVTPLNKTETILAITRSSGPFPRNGKRR